MLGLPRPTLALTLLLAMLSVVFLLFGTTVLFSNWAVQREFQRLPPEVQAYLRSREQAERAGQVLAPTPPIPEIRTGTPADPYLPRGWSSPDVSGEVITPTGRITVEAGARWRTGRDPARANFPPPGRSQDFLATIQGILWRVGLLTAVVAAGLAWVLSRRIARPLTQVSMAAQRLAAGDLSARAPALHAEREVTELALNFNRMADNLQTLETERQQAAADIAHELRTPIAVMQARLDALEDGIYPLEAAQVTSLSQQTQLLSRLVDDLRTLTLSDAGQLKLRQQAVNLPELCLDVTSDLQARAQAQGVTLNFSVQGHAPAPFQGDPDRLRQIVLNLLENALRHARTQVQLTLLGSESSYHLHVEDDGPGIPADAHEKIFTRFTRLDPSRSRGTGGSGLGLSIVQAFVQAHGGSVAVSSGALGGAKFTVSLPLTAQPRDGLLVTGR